MKAAVYRRYGLPDIVQIEDVEKPVPKDNEVPVRVHATTVCAADWRVRKADPFFVRFFTGLWKPKRAMIGGMEVAGTVESVGKAVTRFRAGDQVFGGNRHFGAHAEYLCVPEGDGTLEIKPANMTFEEAAAVMFGGISALYFLRKVNIQAGRKVLIYGCFRRSARQALRRARDGGMQHRQSGTGEVSGRRRGGRLHQGRFLESRQGL